MKLLDYTYAGRYERLPIPKRFKAWLLLARPYTLLAPLVGTWAAAHINGAPIDTHFIFVALTLLFAVAASNIQNQAWEVDIDRVNKAGRPIPQGLITAQEANLASLVLFFFALFRAATISATFGFLILLILLAIVAYNLPPLHLKRVLLVNNVTIALSRGLLGFLAAWSAFGSIVEPTPWLIAVPLFAFLIGATEFKNVSDVEGDKAFGVRTLMTEFGRRRAALLVAPVVTIPWGVVAFLLPRGWLLAPVLLVLSAFGIRDLAAGRPRSWLLMYAVINLYFVGVAILL